MKRLLCVKLFLRMLKGPALMYRSHYFIISPFEHGREKCMNTKVSWILNVSNFIDQNCNIDPAWYVTKDK